MFWNIVYNDVKNKDTLMYVKAPQMTSYELLNDAEWLRKHSSNSRCGAKFFSSKNKNALTQQHYGDLPDGFRWVCASMRFRSALYIDQGAVNLVAISYSLYDATQEAFDMQVGSAYTDSAVCMIVNQMAHLCGLGSPLGVNKYREAMQHCINMCNDGGIKV